MKKGKKRSAAVSCPASDYSALGEEAKMRLRHRSLLRDYEDLTKETEAKKMRLQQANQKKSRLLAEVKFLRRKYKSLLKNPLGNSSCLLSKKPQSMPLFSLNQPSNPSFRFPAKDQSSSFQNAAAQSNSTVIDLNQASLPIGESMDKHQVKLEPAKVAKLRKMDPDLVANDLSLSICRGVGNAPNRDKKRKITWQDPVALRV